MSFVLALKLWSAPSHVRITVFSEDFVAADKAAAPAGEPQTAVGVILGAGAPVETGWASPTVRVTAGDLDGVVRRAMKGAGFGVTEKLEDAKIIITYGWGIHCRPDDAQAQSASSHVLGNLRERAVLVGGEAFAQRVVNAHAERQRNRDFSPIDGAATNVTFAPMGMADPVYRLRSESSKMGFLYDQSVADCYFVVVTARRFELGSSTPGELLWKTTATVTTRGLGQTDAFRVLLLGAAPFYGRATKEAEIIKTPVAPAAAK